MSGAYKQKGVAALAITMTILFIVTIITLFSARVIVTDNKIYNNEQNNAYALNAAQAGFDYALGYLNASPYAVIGTATPNGLGFCVLLSNYSLPSGTLANGATYTMKYTCVTSGATAAFNQLLITATGTSPDGISTRTITTTVKQYCGISNPVISRSTTTVGTVATPIVANNYPDAFRSIVAGGTVTLSNGGKTSTATGGAYSCSAAGTSPFPAGTCLDITPSSTSLALFSTPANFEQLYLGNTIVGLSALATAANTVTCATGGTKTFTDNANGGGCVLGAGLGTFLMSAANAGKLIYINMSGGGTLTLNTRNGGTTTLATAASPAVVVVRNAATVNLTTNNGAGSTLNVNAGLYTTSTLTITEGTSGTTTLNGLAFSDGALVLSNGARVNGAVVVNNTASIRSTPDGGTGNVLYDSTGAGYINAMYHGYCGGAYGIVAGSWKDF